MHSNHDSIIYNYFFISVAGVLSLFKYILLIMYMHVSLYAGAHGSQKRVSDPIELEAVVNDLPELRTLGMAVTTPPYPILWLFHCYSISSRNWREVGGPILSVRLVKTMITPIKVYSICPSIHDILEMQTYKEVIWCGNSVFRSAVPQRPPQMP